MEDDADPGSKPTQQRIRIHITALFFFIKIFVSNVLICYYNIERKNKVGKSRDIFPLELSTGIA